MKKHILIIISLMLMIFTLSACGTKPDEFKAFSKNNRDNITIYYYRDNGWPVSSDLSDTGVIFDQDLDLPQEVIDYDSQIKAKKNTILETIAKLSQLEKQLLDNKNVSNDDCIVLKTSDGEYIRLCLDNMMVFSDNNTYKAYTFLNDEYHELFTQIDKSCKEIFELEVSYLESLR